MKRLLYSTICLLGPLLTEVCALDLTPHAVTTAYNNLRSTRYFFDDGGKSMAFRIDNNMTVKGGSSSAAFKFSDLRNAEMQIRKSPKTPETLFVGKDLEAYRTDARVALPEGASEVQIERENAAAIPINGWTSYQFILRYKLFGASYRRSVTFLNYNKVEQLIIDVSAPDSTFDLAYLRSYQVLNSLSELRKDAAGST
jgi:hypothetical protein